MKIEKKIPDEIANQICQLLIEKNNKRWLSFNKLWCTICKSRCISGNEYNRGCSQVNKVYDNGFQGNLDDK